MAGPGLRGQRQLDRDRDDAGERDEAEQANDTRSAAGASFGGRAVPGCREW
jgi:hypothetical protein